MNCFRTIGRTLKSHASKNATRAFRFWYDRLLAQSILPLLYKDQGVLAISPSTKHFFFYYAFTGRAQERSTPFIRKRLCCTIMNKRSLPISISTPSGSSREEAKLITLTATTGLPMCSFSFRSGKWKPSTTSMTTVQQSGHGVFQLFPVAG